MIPASPGVQIARSSRPLTWWAASALLAAFAVALYWRAPLLGFAGDDALVLYHLKRLGGLSHAGAFFSSLDFFSYYRPIGFLTFAADAAAWSARPAGFHVTNVVLHAVNGLLVFALARRILPLAPALLAAALFVAHPSNQEAVYWISARFDLLSTAFTLLTLLVATKPGAGWTPVALVTFGLALLSKEAALACPVMVGAYEVFVRRSPARRVAVLLGLLLAVIGIYAVGRSAVGGLDPTGGASRLPKAAALMTVVFALAAISWTGWQRLDAFTARLRPLAFGAGLAAVAAVAAFACTLPVRGVMVREKLSFAGFSGFYLLSPVVAPASPAYFLDPATPIYWAGGLAIAAAALGGLFAWRRRIASDGAWLFVIVATVGALIPVSSLTEGQRYLYLGSIGVALALAKIVADARGRARKLAGAAAAVVLAVSIWQVQVKGADWAWATGMLSRGAALVNADLPACDSGQVIFLTAPVGIRGVYTHFYHQTFSQDDGCEPGSYQAVVRAIREDQPIDVRWDGPSRLVVRASAYRGNFLLSADLHQFTVPQRGTREARLDTPLGLVVSRPDGDAQVVTLDLAPSLDLSRARFYYFSNGEVHRVPASPAAARIPR